MGRNDYCKRTIKAQCSCCGKEESYIMNAEEAETLLRYKVYGRQLGYIQELFPDIPAWIRSGAIDLYSGGFCICPDCSEV